MVDQGKPDRPGRRVAVVGSGVTGLTAAWALSGSARPSARPIADTVATGTGLRVTERFSMGGHYAHTLRLWQERFDGYTDRTSALGCDPVFQRIWAVLSGLYRGGLPQRLPGCRAIRADETRRGVIR